MVDHTRREEAWHLAWVIADMQRLDAGGHLGAEGRALLQRYRDWYTWLAGPAPATPPASAGAVPPPPP
ncbi:MAG: hypothetical protein JWM18_752, partial [Chloroflexi bacterium]|nr:hypothetical protein [Chloroflexota bacterium]